MEDLDSQRPWADWRDFMENGLDLISSISYLLHMAENYWWESVLCPPCGVPGIELRTSCLPGSAFAH